MKIISGGCKLIGGAESVKIILQFYFWAITLYLLKGLEAVDKMYNGVSNF